MFIWNLPGVELGWRGIVRRHLLASQSGHAGSLALGLVAWRFIALWSISLRVLGHAVLGQLFLAFLFQKLRWHSC